MNNDTENIEFWRMRRECAVKRYTNKPTNTQLLIENTNHFLAYIKQEFLPAVVIVL